jgi:hypothetical protein
MKELPLHIQALIVSKSDVPIDTYLYYKEYGAIPKKINLQNYDFLNKFYGKRVEIYKRKLTIEAKTNYINSTYLFWTSKHLENGNSLSMLVYTNENIIKFNMKKYKLIDYELFMKNILTVDIHTGKAVEEFY